MQLIARTRFSFQRSVLSKKYAAAYHRRGATVQAKHMRGMQTQITTAVKALPQGPVRRYHAAKRRLRFLGRRYGCGCRAEARLSVISRRNVICVFTAQRGLSTSPQLKLSHQPVPDRR